VSENRIETDSLGKVEVPADKLWGAQTQRSLEHFSIGQDLMPREMITAYSILKRGAAAANHAGGRLTTERFELITPVETVPNMGVIMLPREMSGDAGSFCGDPPQASR
jgi:fumarate hydratase, class II